MRSISVLAEEEQETWVNQHPGLEQIVSDGLVEAINVYDKSLNAIIDVPDFQYRSNPADKVQKVFNAWRGELRKMKSIVRVGGLNVTRLNKDRRELSFFVKLNLMEITYHIYNQSNFGFPKEGKIVIRPDSNLILVKCAAVRETVDDANHVIKSWVRVMNATIVSLSAGRTTVRLFPSDNPDRPDYMNVNDINELVPPLIDTIGNVFLTHVRLGINTALKRKNLSEFYRDYFSKNHTSDEPYRL